MIFWIASYPKSGNTWTRLFIVNYLNPNQENVFNNLENIFDYPRLKYFDFLKNDDLEKVKKFNNDIFKDYIISQDKLNLNKNLNFLKTHSYCGAINNFHFTNKENTSAFVYLVRDPRSIAVSLSYHTNYSIDKVIENMIYEKHTVQNDDEVLSIWSSWKINYLSWRNLDIPKVIIKYEDLLQDPNIYFKKILNLISKFKKIDINETLINKTIEKCNFQKLKDNEKKYGFNEKFGEEKFFRKGLSNEWKDILKPSMIRKIENVFEKEMKELNYL